MSASRCAALVAAAIALAAPAPGRGQTDIDSLRVAELVAAESAVDSLRAEIRRLDRDLQALKQDWADAEDVDRLLDALGQAAPDPDAPEDTRSRRQRVDALLRAITQRPGQLRFNGGATVVVQDLVSGGVDASAGTGSLDLYAHTSFGPRTLLFFAFEAGGGEGLDGVLALRSPINGDAVSTRGDEGFDHLVLNEAWAEFTALGESVALTVGKIDLSNYFDINAAANDETAQFLSGAFVNSAAFLVPPPGPGIRARTVVLHRFSTQVGLVSADATGGTRFRDVFAIGSLGFRTFPDTEREGNLRGYLYRPPDGDGALGGGLSLDQKIVVSLTAFGRWGRNEDALGAAGSPAGAWSAGLSWEASPGGRDVVVGAAWGATEDAAGTEETVFELYASSPLNTWTHLSPHVQVVRDPAARSRAVTALGLRARFDF